MTDTRSNDLVGDLLRIHAVITRGIDIAIESEMRKGSPLFIESLFHAVEGHHNTEDEVIFPFFVEKIPEIPFAELEEEHRQLSKLIEEKDLLGLKQLWTKHIRTEEKYFTKDKLDSLLNIKEQIEYRIKVGQTAGKHSQPPFLVIPFILYNLDEDERKVFAKNLPPEVLDLVTTAWQEKWKPMEHLFYSKV
jgi:hypothetical protein